MLNYLVYKKTIPKFLNKKYLFYVTYLIHPLDLSLIIFSVSINWNILFRIIHWFGRYVLDCFGIVLFSFCFLFKMAWVFQRLMALAMEEGGAWSQAGARAGFVCM